MPYTDYENYAWTDIDTFSILSIKFHVPKDEILKINNLCQPIPDTLSKVKGLPKIIKIPIVPVTDNAIVSYPVSVVWGRTPQRASGAPSSVGFQSQGKCSLKLDPGGTIFFPCFPETFNDSRQANYSPQNPIGRSEPFQIYQNSGPRVVSVTFRMHREMCHQTSIDEIVATVFSCTYPIGNSSSGHITPRVTLSIGNNCTITGIVDSNVSADWGETILFDNNDDDFRNGKYSTVTLSFSVTECTGNPKTASAVANDTNFRS